MAKWEDDILRGQSRINEKDRKDHGIILRLTESEKEKLKLIAENEGVSMSSFLRKKINEEYSQMLGYGINGALWL